MNIKEVINTYKNEYTDIEVYYSISRNGDIHTDNLRFIEEIPEDDMDGTGEVISWDLMDEEDYNNSVLANSCIEADFAEWYDDKNAKVLVILM